MAQACLRHDALRLLYLFVVLQADEEETVSTLRFGTRAKKIKNRVRVNRQLSAEQLAAKLDALVRYVAAIEKENEATSEAAVVAEAAAVRVARGRPAAASTHRHRRSRLPARRTAMAIARLARAATTVQQAPGEEARRAAVRRRCTRLCGSSCSWNSS